MDFTNENRNVQIGSYLKTLREEQNLSIEQLSKLCQVPAVHVTAIEAGRFSRYDDFYLKLYLKKYTQALDVDLEQLYTYANQQEAPELPVETEPKKKLTGMQADIATVAPKKEKTIQAPRVKTTIETKGVTTSSSKSSIGRFLAVLFLILIVGAIITVAIIALRNTGNNDNNQDTFVPPPIVINNPHDINGEDDEVEDNDDEPIYEPEPEPEPIPEDFTVIEIEGHVGQIQTFIVMTYDEEINLRIEHSDQNWINITNRIHTDTFEYTFDTSDSPINFSVGAVHAIEAMFVNDVEVPITTDGLTGRQTFIFNITLTGDDVPNDEDITDNE